MRLGTQTGSLMNHVHASTAQPEPVAGMGVTILMWSDRKAGTVEQVFYFGAYQYIEVKTDIATRTDNNGMSDCQSYDYRPNPDAVPTYWRLDRNGTWRQAERVRGRWVYSAGKSSGSRLRLGVRDAYHDYGF